MTSYEKIFGNKLSRIWLKTAKPRKFLPAKVSSFKVYKRTETTGKTKTLHDLSNESDELRKETIDLHVLIRPYRNDQCRVEHGGNFLQQISHLQLKLSKVSYKSIFKSHIRSSVICWFTLPSRRSGRFWYSF